MDIITETQKALALCLRILRKCDEQTQPQPHLLSTILLLLDRMGRSGDYEELTKRVDALDDLRNLIQSSQTRQRGI